MKIGEFFYFIAERHKVYLHKEAGLPKPWTDDPILQKFKFCNVYRELDRVTIWIRENIREPFADNPNLWFMLCIARRINWPDTLAEAISSKVWPVKTYDPQRFLQFLDARTARKEQVYTGAYMITASREIGATKSRATAYDSLGRLWDDRKNIEADLNRVATLSKAFQALRGKGFAWGDFMTAQVVADLKFTRYFPEESTLDWWSWAAPGPGSMRGMNRVIGEPIGTPFKSMQWESCLLSLGAEIAPRIKEARMPYISAQDLQNALCEFDKHQRVKLGEGRPRSLYPGV